MAILDVTDPGRLEPLPGIVPGSDQDDRNQVWSPDGRSLAYIAALSSNDYEIRVVDMAGGGERVVYTDDGTEGGLVSLDWSPDGQFLLTLETGIRRGSGEAFYNVIEIDAATQTSAVVLNAAIGGDLSYSAPDRSRITTIHTLQFGDPILAQTWTRGEDGTYLLTSSAELGKDVGLVGADRLTIPDCAIA